MIGDMVVEYSASPWSLFMCFLREFLSHNYLHIFISSGDEYGWTSSIWSRVSLFYYYQLQFYLVLIFVLVIDIDEKMKGSDV